MALEYAQGLESSMRTCSPVQENLCEVCRTIGLSPEKFVPHIDERGTRQYTDGVYALGDIRDIAARKECAICRLVTRCLEDHPTYKKRDGEYRISWSAHGESEAGGHHNKSCLTIQHGASATAAQSSDSNIGHGSIMGLQREEEISPYFWAREIGEEVHLDLLKQWLQCCSQWHGESCDKLPFEHTRKPSELPEFLVIDVHEERIRALPTGCRYIALSYVWGKAQSLMTTKANLETSKAPKGLGNQKGAIARTIWDSVILTRELGERYLWVDQLCIIQDDSESKQKMINNMDAVYGHAFLTIIAATGANADAGLPGSPGRPRAHKQATETIHNGLKLAAIPELLGMLYASVYESRGWTFQEYTLSRRCLVFLGDRVFFRCRRSLWREDVHGEYESEPGATTWESRTWSTNMDLPNFGQSQNVTLRAAQSYQGPNWSAKDFGKEHEAESTYVHCISKITARNFSYPSDILDAVAGVLKPLAASLASEVHYGILWYIINVAVLWSLTGSHTARREGFPSWSWAGWVGGVERIHSWGLVQGYNHWISSHCWIHWMYLSPNMPVAFNPEIFLGIPNGLPQHAQTLEDAIKNQIFRLLDVGRLPRIPWRPGGINDNPPPLDSILWIWTVVFNLRITAQVFECDRRPFVDRSLTDSIFDLQDSSGKFAGRFIYQRTGTSMVVSSLGFLAVSIWDQEQPYSSNLAERLGFGKFDRGEVDWSAGIDFKVIRYHNETTGEQHAAPLQSIYPSLEERQEARFFNVLVVEWQKSGIAERVGIGLVLETGIKGAVDGGPVWGEVLLG